MKNYDAIFAELKFPVMPKFNPPVRDQFDSNAAWGIALDQHDAQVAAATVKYRAERKAYRETFAKIESQFWNDLYADLGWDKLPKEVASEKASAAWEQGHSFGYNEVYLCAQYL